MPIATKSRLQLKRSQYPDIAVVIALKVEASTILTRDFKSCQRVYNLANVFFPTVKARLGSACHYDRFENTYGGLPSSGPGCMYRVPLIWPEFVLTQFQISRPLDPPPSTMEEPNTEVKVSPHGDCRLRLRYLTKICRLPLF